jgi:hypothetical protein
LVSFFLYLIFLYSIQLLCVSINKKGNGYQLLLKDVIGNFDLVTLKHKSKKYFDLLLVTHSSAIEHELEIHKFDGVKYKLSKCVTETAITNAQDNISYQYKEHSCH